MADDGLTDDAFVREHTTGWPELAAILDRHSLDDLARWSGSTVDDMRESGAHLRGREVGDPLVRSMGVTQHATGSENVRAIINPALARGNVGRPGAGLMPIRGHSGVQGGAEMGAYATILPGGEPITVEAAARWSVRYGFPIGGERGRSAAEMAAGGRGELDVLWSVGGNFLETLPDPAAVREALERILLRVHQDIVLSPQMLVDAAEATLVLPATTRYEQPGGGTETTTERRIVLSPGDPRTAHRGGARRVAGACRARPPRRSRRRRFDRTRRRAGHPRGDRRRDPALRRHPAPATHRRPGPVGRVSAVLDGWTFDTDDGRAHFAAVEPAEATLEPGRFRLATRRGKQFNTMVWSRRDPLTGADRDGLLMAPEDRRAGRRRRLAGAGAVEHRGGGGPGPRLPDALRQRPDVLPRGKPVGARPPGSRGADPGLHGGGRGHPREILDGASNRGVASAHLDDVAGLRFRRMPVPRAACQAFPLRSCPPDADGPLLPAPYRAGRRTRRDDPRRVRLHQAGDIGAVLRVLKEREGEAKVLAGGHSLLPLLKLRLAAPSPCRCACSAGSTRSSRRTTSCGSERWRRIARSLRTRSSPATCCCRHRRWHRGSAGPKLGHHRRVVRARRPLLRLAGGAPRPPGPPSSVAARDGERVIGAPDFFIDSFATAIEPSELLTEIRFRRRPRGRAGRTGSWSAAPVTSQPSGPRSGCGSRTARLRTPASASPRSPRARSPRPMQRPCLVGADPTEETFARAAEAASGQSWPVSDAHGPAEYKRSMVREMTLRALRAAHERAVAYA